MRRVIPLVPSSSDPKLPPGVTPGAQVPGGPTIYLAQQPEPNVVLLYRWYIPEGPTAYHRAGPPTGEYHRGHPLFVNTFGAKWGWTLNAMGPKAELERGISGPSAADRLRHWFVQLPQSGRVALQRADLISPGDPLRAPGNQFRQWVSDECIGSLIRAASQGSSQVAPLLFAVQPKQSVRVDQETFAVNPIGELVRILQESDADCRLEQPGMPLSEAARILGFSSRHKPLSAAPEILFEAWRQKAATARGRDQLIANAAYHRILLHRFLRQRRLTPRIYRSSALSAAIERRANLIQAYRVFVFDRRGCPVGLNVPLLEANHLEVKSLLDKQVQHAGFTMMSARAKHFGAWLFSDVLDQPIVKCKPQGIQGLDALLAASDRFA